MIKQIICQCTLEGENFNPNILSIPASINVLKKCSVGEIIDFGRNKGEKSEVGFVIINGNIDETLAFLRSPNLVGFSIKHFNILVSFENQCNFELTIEQLSSISELKIPVGITCYSNE